MTAAGNSAERGIGDRIAATWNEFWFRPVAARHLAIVRTLGGALALVLWWSYAADLDTWFGPSGMISPGLLADWRSAHAVSLFDVATSAGALRLAYLVGGLMLLGLTIGCATPVTGPLAAIAFVSLLHRGPMLVGPADDVVAIVLWCLVIGRSGDALSVDRLVGRWLGRPPAAPSIRTRIAIGLLRIHATVLAVAALLAQLKGDVWWNGTAAWWLAARADSPPVDLTGLFLRSEYLMNLVTHAIVIFEIVFAAGIWIPAVSRPVAVAGLVGWPLVGVVAGEPAWGAALAVLASACLPASVESPD